MLRIYKYPEYFSKGLEDRFNGKMEQGLNASGIPCKVRALWPDRLTRLILDSRVPHAHQFFVEVVAPFFSRAHLSAIKPEDVVWINGASVPSDTSCWLEKSAIRKGASYVFWLEDDWFSDNGLNACALSRTALADLIVAVTPTLVSRIHHLFPRKPVIALEEAVDTDRLQPKSVPGNRQRPLVVWGGRIWNLRKLLVLNGVLQRVYREIPFDLRIITGTRKPEIPLSIPWEWRPYSRGREAEYNAGAVAGLAPLEDTVYNVCKGNYKIKTYMAMGVPPLTSPVGYNRHLIRHGETGFLLDSEAEWASTLRLLLRDPCFAAKIGTAARAETVRRFSYAALMPVWTEALRGAFPTRLPGKPH